jgi:Flp pilus assembly protein TadG
MIRTTNPDRGPVRPAAIRRGEGDEGAILVEAALVIPFLVLLILGLMEFGFAWRNDNVVAASVRTATRVATQSLSNPQADRYAIEAYLGTVAQGRNLTTNKLIIYAVNETTNPSGAVPAGCLSATTTSTGPNGVTDVCNVYVPNQWTTGNLVAANFGCGATQYDAKFCPTTDRTASLPATPTTVGFYADVTYKLLTKILPGSTLSMSDKSVARVEPSPV